MVINLKCSIFYNTKLEISNNFPLFVFPLALAKGSSLKPNERRQRCIAKTVSAS